MSQNHNGLIMKRRFAIGDIHGCELTFRKLLFDNLHITREDEIYLLGDLIDRGPRIRELIDSIIKLREYGYKIIAIKGNHEWMLRKSIESDAIFKMWMLNNGQTTLRSFNVNDPAHIPEMYLQFFSKMPSFIKLEKYVLVHAGLNFEKKNPLKHKRSMVWMRNEKVRKKDMVKIGGRSLIVGHTPVSLEKVLSSNKTNKIMLDGGCIYKGRYPGVGYLVAYDIDNDNFFYEENVDF